MSLIAPVVAPRVRAGKSRAATRAWRVLLVAALMLGLGYYAAVVFERAGRSQVEFSPNAVLPSPA